MIIYLRINLVMLGELESLRWSYLLPPNKISMAGKKTPTYASLMKVHAKAVSVPLLRRKSKQLRVDFFFKLQ